MSSVFMQFLSKLVQHSIVFVLMHASILPLYHHLFCRCALPLVVPTSSFAPLLLDFLSGWRVRKQRPGMLAVVTAASAVVGAEAFALPVFDRNKTHGSVDMFISCTLLLILG